MKKTTALFLLLAMLMCVSFAHAAIKQTTTNIFDEMWGSAADLLACGDCHNFEYDEYFSAWKGNGEIINTPQTIQVIKTLWVENLTGTDRIILHCFKNGDQLSLPNPEDGGATLIGGGYSVIINASNFGLLPYVGTLQGASSGKHYYRFNLTLKYPASQPSVSGGDEVECDTSFNWENETNAWRPSIGAVDKLSTFTDTVIPNPSASQMNSLFLQFTTITGFIVSLVTLNWTLITIIYWLVLIVLVIGAIGIFLAVPYYLYLLVKRIGAKD